MVIDSKQRSDMLEFVAQLFTAVFNLEPQEAQQMAVAARSNVTELLAASESETPGRSLALTVIVDAVASDS